MTNTLIIGCGDIGQRVAARLNKHWQVYGVRRNVHELPSTITPVKADLAKEDLVEAFSPLPRNFEVVIIIMTPNERGVDAYAQSYINNPNNAKAALMELGIRFQRVIYLSSTSVYGQDDGGWVDESSPTRPASRTGEVLLEAEAAVRQWPAETIVVRSSGIYGEGRERLLRQMIAGVRYLQQPIHYTNRIHQDDLAAFIVWLMAMAHPESTYIASDNQPATLYEIQQWIITQLNLDTNGEWRASPRRTGSKRLKNKRLLQTGFALTYPDYRRGYAGLIQN